MGLKQGSVRGGLGQMGLKQGSVRSIFFRLTVILKQQIDHGGPVLEYGTRLDECVHEVRCVTVDLALGEERHQVEKYLAPLLRRPRHLTAGALLLLG